MVIVWRPFPFFVDLETSAPPPPLSDIWRMVVILEIVVVLGRRKAFEDDDVAKAVTVTVTVAVSARRRRNVRWIMITGCGIVEGLSVVLVVWMPDMIAIGCVCLVPPR